MIDIVFKYKNILTELPEILRASPYKKSYIIEKTGISAPTFYRKLKDNSFTVDEVISILRLAKPEQAYKYELLQGLAKADEDIKKGRLHSAEDVIKEARNLIK